MSTLIDPVVVLSWKGSVVAVVAGLCLLLLRRHLSPAWRHGLWLLVLLRFLLPDLGTSRFAMAGVLGTPETVQEAVVIVDEPMTVEVVMPLQPAEPVEVVAQEVTVMPEAPSWTWEEVLTGIWLAGGLSVLGVMGLLHLRLLGRIRKDGESANPETLAILDEACRMGGVRRAPRLVVTDAVRAPSLFGIIRPAILLPKTVAASENAEELRLILLHELAHLKRWDLCSQVIASLAIALHWFNPLVWWAGRRLRAEAEMAADARALRSGDAAEAYRMGDLLLGFANHAAAGWLLAFLAVTQMGISDNKRDLRRRIEALMDLARGRRTRWFVGLGLFLALALSGLTRAPAQEATRLKPAPAPATAPEPMPGWVSGTIQGKADGQPVRGATVWLATGARARMPVLLLLHMKSTQGTETMTDDAGHYRLPRKAEDKNAMVVVQAPGMKLWSTRFDWVNDAMTLDVVLEKEPGISGKVVTADGRPAQEATVSLTNGFSSAWEGPMTANKGDLHFSAQQGHWLGNPATDANGMFTGRMFQEDGRHETWLVARHPEHGLQRTPLKSWKNGGTIQLEPWNSMQGTLVDADGKVLKGKEIKLIQAEFIRDVPDPASLPSQFSLSAQGTCVTDAEGRYKFERMLPHPTSGSVLVDGKYLHLPAGGWTGGKPLEHTLRIPAEPPALPDREARHVRGRVLLPDAKDQPLPAHEIFISINLVGGGSGQRMTELDGQQRFTSNMVAPGDYLLRIWVEPKDKKLTYPTNSGLSLLFHVDPDHNKLLDLGDFTLDAADFAFSPRTASRPPAPRRDQKVNAPAEDSPLFVSWSGSGGSGVGPEFKFTPDGTMVGTVAASTNDRFMLRATKADGSRHFTTAQIATADARGTFTSTLAFHPGVALEGQLRDLPAGYAGEGWVVAAVQVRADATADTVHKGSIPYLTWNAWAPVQKDGRFQFSALPRGSLSLAGCGDGWVTCNSLGSTTEVQANLMTCGPALKMTVDTQPSLESRVRLLRPDGSPAAGASISLSSGPGTMTNLNRAHGRWGYATEDADAEAYARYKETRLPGHEAVADAEGVATLRNLPQRYTTCEVKWMDPETKAEQVEKVDLRVTGRELTIQLAGTQP